MGIKNASEVNEIASALRKVEVEKLLAKELNDIQEEIEDRVAMLECEFISLPLDLLHDDYTVSLTLNFVISSLALEHLHQARWNVILDRATSKTYLKSR